MKVAIISPTDPDHEIAEYTRELSAALRQRDDTTVDIVPLEIGRQSRAYYLQLAEILNTPEIDLVHIQFRHDFWGTLAPAKRLPLAADNMYWHLRFLIKKPLVVTAHETASAAELLKSAAQHSPLIRPMVPILSRNVGYCQSIDIAPFTTAWTIVHSAAERRNLVDRGGRPEFVSIIPLGYDISLAGYIDRAAERCRLRLKDEVFVIQVAGCDGDETLMNGSELGPSVKTTLSYRSGHRRSSCKDRIIDDVDDGLGRSTYLRYVAAGDIVVLPKDAKATDDTLRAALILGRVIVAPDTELFREMRARMDCVELFPVGNKEALTKLLSSLVENAPRRATLAANARKYAERFPWSRAAQLTRGVYQSAYEIYSRGHHPH